MTMATPEFKKFPKIPRFGKFCVTLTEKIDGTNAGVFIGEDGIILAASRNRWLISGAENYGFSEWVHNHADELRTLGPGMHWGEWWGQGIQRGYGLTERRFSLFDVFRWGATFNERSPRAMDCCRVVPVLAILPVFSDHLLKVELEQLKMGGSMAAPGFMDPEGIVVSHNIRQPLYKITFDNAHKGEQINENHTA
jgi:hypothetical protein